LANASRHLRNMLRLRPLLSHGTRLCITLGCICLAAAIGVACAEPTAVSLPAGAIEWAPPARFALWWQMTESCSRRQGDLRAIKWYVVPNVTSIDLNGQRVQGETIGNRIILVDRFRLDGPLVRHEMLHALLPGTSGHPRDQFLLACDGVVVCEGACEKEAGGRIEPSEDAPELDPRDLLTRVEVTPQDPSVSRDSGAVAVIISITNPLATPAWVRLTPPGSDDVIGITFGVSIDYNDGSPRCCAYWGSTGVIGTRFPLAANETRRYVWDEQLWAGDYGIRGWFNADTAPRFVLNVGP
jgi:hypothetical protein